MRAVQESFDLRYDERAEREERLRASRITPPSRYARITADHEPAVTPRPWWAAAVVRLERGAIRLSRAIRRRLS